MLSSASITVLASDWAALAAFALPALVAADDQLLRDSSLGLHSRHLPLVALAATLSRSVCVGTSGRAAPPCKQRTQQSPPFASNLPAAAGHRRPCWSGACACRTRADPVSTGIRGCRPRRMRDGRCRRCCAWSTYPCQDRGRV